MVLWCVAHGVVSAYHLPPYTHIIHPLPTHPRDAHTIPHLHTSSPPSIQHSIAQHVAVLYEEVHRKLCQPPLNQHFERAWVSHIACKGAMYKLLALQHSATALSSGDDLQGCGKGLARLGVCVECGDGMMYTMWCALMVYVLCVVGVHAHHMCTPWNM